MGEASAGHLLCHHASGSVCARTDPRAWGHDIVKLCFSGVWRRPHSDTGPPAEVYRVESEWCYDILEYLGTGGIAVTMYTDSLNCTRTGSRYILVDDRLLNGHRGCCIQDWKSVPILRIEGTSQNVTEAVILRLLWPPPSARKHVLGVDGIFPLDLTSNGNRYKLHVVDHFNRSSWSVTSAIDALFPPPQVLQTAISDRAGLSAKHRDRGQAPF